MKTLRRLSAFGALAAVAVGCSDSVAPEDVTLADLVGTWNATAVTFEPVGGGEGIEVVGELGAALSFTIAASGAYTVTVTAPQEQPQINSGTMTVANGVITATSTGPGEDPGFLEILAFSGDNLTLFSEDEDFDFTDDQIDNPTPATMTMVMVRE
jgi:hypothetical protein